MSEIQTLSLAAWMQGKMQPLKPELFTARHLALAEALVSKGALPNETAVRVWCAKENLDSEFALQLYRMPIAEDGLDGVEDLLRTEATASRLLVAGAQIDTLARAGGTLAQMRDTAQFALSTALTFSHAVITETQLAYEAFDSYLSGEGNQGWILPELPNLMDIIGALAVTKMGIVTSSRTGSGKTAFAMKIALSLLRLGAKVMYASPDMGLLGMWVRMIAMLSGADSRRIEKEAFSKAKLFRDAPDRWMEMADKPIFLTALEYSAVQEASTWLKMQPLTLSSSQLVPELVGLAKENDVDAFIGDYVQMFTTPGIRLDEGYISQTQVTAATFQFRELAKTRWVLLVSQSRDPVPSIHNLAWSSELAKQAHWVIWLDPREDGLTYAMVLKNRGGPEGQVPMLFVKRHTAYIEVPIQPTMSL